MSNKEDQSANEKDPSSPAYYVIQPKLEKAVQLAIRMNKPLLVTGAPGTGKTQLAHKISYDLWTKDKKYPQQPFVFNTKTTSVATDLFYRYDAIGHFGSSRDASSRMSVQKFIELSALGKAIVRTHGKSDKSDLGGINGYNDIPKEPLSSVVLIDEIDKAPRDFPNDLLNEIDNMEFSIREISTEPIRRASNNEKIVVVMTSNYENNLPDAFLRRCLFYHIAPPSPKDLRDVVYSRMKPFLKYAMKLEEMSDEEVKNRYDQLIKKFEAIRGSVKTDLLTTSTLLEWLQALEVDDYFKLEKSTTLTSQQKEKLEYTLPILSKTRDEREAVLAELLR